MKEIKKEEFEAFLLESFKGEKGERELRLSDAEATHLQRKYPNASLTVMEETGDILEKTWYVVKI